MKVIDLLNKIANGEEVPKKIRITDIDDRITRHYNFFYDEDDQEYKDDELFPLGARLILDRVLNEKVEILDKIEEEKKIPEKLNIDKEHNRLFKKDGSYWSIKAHQVYVYEVLNEIIDYIRSKGE